MRDLHIALLGELADHARGRNLTVSFGASPAESLPVHGVAIVFGKEFQRESTMATEWTTWTASPGRLLIVLPPFGRGTCGVPLEWEASWAEALAGGEPGLSQLVARERKYELRGRLNPIERIAGQMATAGWRRHPSAGLLVVTTLPLWSLSLLDKREICAFWLADLYGQAGSPQVEEAAVEQAKAELRELLPNEWTVLLHLCTGPFESDRSALKALAESSIFRIEERNAAETLRELDNLGLASKGELTARGIELLRRGPYAVYADNLRRQHERP
jgi:hypothetical protein